MIINFSSVKFDSTLPAGPRCSASVMLFYFGLVGYRICSFKSSESRFYFSLHLSAPMEASR